jgi:hypothetical protein
MRGGDEKFDLREKFSELPVVVTDVGALVFREGCPSG